MQRILDPAQIEALADRSVPRIRLPDPLALFAQRAQRLRALAEGHSLGDYLRLMAALADRQQAALESLAAAMAFEQFTQQIGRQIELAHEHKMPPLQAAGWPRPERWRTILNSLCTSIAGTPGFPTGVRVVCERIMDSPGAEIEAQADLLIAARTVGVDAPAAPFLMAALQIYWTAMVTTLKAADVEEIDVKGVCPTCGSLPVASIVRADKRSQGYRYLHCGLCATEWHMVRITCSQCFGTEGIVYHSIEGGSEAVRAESCGQCHTYRKILYQEKDPGVEPVADDLATVALDLLMTEEGFHRGSGNPLLWHNMEN